MSKTVKKVAKIVGIAALAVTGIGLFVAPAALGVLGGVSAAANAIGLTTLFSIGTAALSIGMLPGKPKRIEDTGADQRGRAFLDPNALAAFAFGTTTVPCALVFEQRHADNQTVTNVVAHTWHRIESYVSLHANGELISFSGDDATGDWAGLLTWRRALGTQSSALNLTGTDWPNDAVGEGVAYSALTWRYRENSEKLRGGIPLNLDVVVQGAWLYDPRLDNEYGSGSQDFDDPSSWSFNDGNAALVLLRMLIGEYDGDGRLVWGRGAQESEIDMASFVAMANVADETVDDKPRYRLGGIHLLSGNWAEFVRHWEEETGGKLYKASGLYKVWLPHDDLTPLTTITEDDLLASEEIKLAIGNLSGMYNCARGRYIEPEEGYRAFPYPEVEEGTAISDDGMRRVLYHDFAWVQDVEIAERTARQLVRRSRFPRVWGVTLGWKGLDPKYEPFTVHTLNISETGNNNQLVRVIDRSISFDGRVRLLLQQEDESIYDDTVPLGDPFQSLGVSDRLDRIETVAPRYIDGTLVSRQRQGWAVDAAGKPAYIRGVSGIANRSQLSLVDGWMRIESTPDSTVAYGFPAVPIDENKTYQVTVRHRSSASSPDGFYLRMDELAGPLPAGKTHIGSGSGETVTEVRDSFVELVNNGPMPGTTPVEQTFTYTPTAGTKFASLSFYNWGASTAGVVYEVEWAALTDTASNVDLLPGVTPPLDRFLMVPEAVTANVVQSAAVDVELATTFGGAYGTLVVLNYTVPDGETWRLSVEFNCWALIGTAVGAPAGNFRVLVNSSPIQKVRTFDAAMAGQEHLFAWTYVDDFSGGTHNFAIQGRATSGACTSRHCIIKITVLKR